MKIPKWTARVTRDLLVFNAALVSFLWEVFQGGGRAQVLLACTGLLVSPIIMRVDEARKEKNGKREADDGGEIDVSAGP